jgi:hypothetical protein
MREEQEKYYERDKTTLIHEEMIRMSKLSANSSTPAREVQSTGQGSGSEITGESADQLALPIADLLIKKKKLQRQQSQAASSAGPARSSSSTSSTTISRPKSSLKRTTSSTTRGATGSGNGGSGTSTGVSVPSNSVGEYIDYRHILPSKLLSLEHMARVVLLNPNIIEELIDLEAMFLDCYREILLFGCNVPSDLFEVHTLWISLDEGRYVVPLTPSEKPTNSWRPVPSCLVQVSSASSAMWSDHRSTLPAINRRVSEIVLLVLRALGVECPSLSALLMSSSGNGSGEGGGQGGGRGGAYLNPQFMVSSNWSGLVDMTPFIDTIRNMELRSFVPIENSLGRVVWVEKGVAGRMHAPNMSVSDQVFRELFKVRATLPSFPLLCLTVSPLFFLPPSLLDREPAEPTLSLRYSVMQSITLSPSPLESFPDMTCLSLTPHPLKKSPPLFY